MNEPIDAAAKLSLAEFARLLSQTTTMRENRFHPFVWIIGEPEIGEGTVIGGFSEVNAKGARVVIGRNCDIASFVSLNCADSHRRCLGLSEEIHRADITLGDNVFVGSHSMIKGGARIGHHCVIAAGSIVDRCDIAPYSLITGNPMRVKEGYYLDARRSKHV